MQTFGVPGGAFGTFVQLNPGMQLASLVHGNSGSDGKHRVPMHVQVMWLFMLSVAQSLSIMQPLKQMGAVWFIIIVAVAISSQVPV
jgi:hypothetical protein